MSHADSADGRRVALRIDPRPLRPLGRNRDDLVAHLSFFLAQMFAGEPDAPWSWARAVEEARSSRSTAARSAAINSSNALGDLLTFKARDSFLEERWRLTRT
jgi:hypothetical protein